MGQSLAEYAERLAEYAERQQGTEEVPSSDVSKVRDNNPLTRKMFNRDSTANAIMEQGSDNSDPVLGGIAEIYKPRKSLAQDVDALVEATPLTPGELTETLLMGEPPAEAQTKLLDEAGIPEEEQTTADWATYAHAFAEKMMAPLAKGEDGSTFGSVIGAMTHAGKVTHDEFKEVLKDDKEWDRKLKEAQAKADKAAEASLKGKTRTIYNEETGRDVVYRDVPPGTKGAIPDDLHPGRWIRPEPKKPSKTSGKAGKGERGAYSTLTSEAQERIKKLVAASAQGVPGYGDQYTDEGKAKLKELDEQIEEARLDSDPAMMGALEDQKTAMFETEKGHWARMKKDGGQDVFMSAIISNVDRDLGDGIITDDEYHARIGAEATKAFGYLGLGTEFEKPRDYKYNPNFSNDTLKMMHISLNDATGEGWFDTAEPGVADTVITQYKLMLEDPVTTKLFKTDLATAIQKQADKRKLPVGSSEFKSELNAIVQHALTQLHGNDTVLSPYKTGGARTRYNSNEIRDYVPIPQGVLSKYQEQYGPDIEWKQGSKGWGLFGFPDNGWVSAKQLGLN